MDFDFGDDDAWDAENMTTAPVDPECEGVEPPDLSKVSMADLLHIKSKMDSEGFTVDLGMLINPSHPVSSSQQFQPRKSVGCSTPSPTVTL